MGTSTTSSTTTSTMDFVSNSYRKYQLLIDRCTPYALYRWLAAGFLLALYFFRVIYIGGFYVVTYALGIFLLNIFLAFLTPKFDPNSNFGDDEDSASPLPTSADEEFRPFIRRLPEFKFWHSAIISILIALFCTFFSILDIPVFWPILLIYFIVLFFLTMRRQIKHMIKHRYIPLDFGKKTYGGNRK